MHLRIITIVSLLLAVLSPGAGLSAAEPEPALKLAHIFQDNMVLQAGVTVPVWGWADPGAQVDVGFAGQSKPVTAGPDGYWRINLDDLPVAKEAQVLTIASGDAKLERKGILVGEVWFCAGQSNMAQSLGQVAGEYPDLGERMGETEFPAVRFIRYPSEPALQPQKDRKGGQAWVAFTSKTIPSCMAMPFFFARKIHLELDVPVGLIQVAVSGTTQTAWTPRDVLDKVAVDTGSKLNYEGAMDAAKKRYGNVELDKNYPAVLFNGQVNPFVPFAFRGVIWHQGEGGPFTEHAERMVALVNSWRGLFEQDFVYLWGALSRGTTSPPPIEPVVKSFYRGNMNRFFLQAQQLFGFDSNSAFCDFYDLGNHETHWGEKDRGGARFALAALTLAYGHPRIFTGPQLIEAAVKAGEIRLTFARVGGGLVYMPTFDGISGFVLESGKEQLWVEPIVEGKDTLVFTHDKIMDGCNLFYAYHNNPHETLFNKEGFPASTFQMKPGNYPRMTDPVELIRFVKKASDHAVLSITHVRRDVFVLRVVERKGAGANRVQVVVPKEWGGVGAQHHDRPVQVSEMVVDSEGRRTTELDVETNAGSYMIYNSARAEEALAEADVSRF